ncbi:Crp/Fnr family transcriptional regulator [Actinomadura chibensis]|uniref:Crp/Fnr family transcriptional regulator n=1 Tax=Actinomadura chibensis TaxID=392828 RepID=A0A5D0NUE3_9ACTN|nr:Crp/Fnr family transcriptional regulator [Actinomadura chibensis]TYB48126.1 Crp/Fnr family transcriptional regulator [Actinomadura chibensis]
MSPEPAGVSARTWELLVANGVPRRCRAGEVLLRQGDPASHVLLLMSGRVKALLTLPDGEVLLLAVRGPGELLGEVGVLGGDGRSATVVAIDPCAVRALSADRFRALLRESGAEEELLRRAMRRLREGEEWRAETAALPAGPRVVRALLRLAVPGGGVPSGGDVVDVGLGQTQIGQAVGLSRGVVAGELARLRALGVVTTERGRTVITDLPRLRALAASGRGSV